MCRVCIRRPGWFLSRCSVQVKRRRPMAVRCAVWNEGSSQPWHLRVERALRMRLSMASPVVVFVRPGRVRSPLLAGLVVPVRARRLGFRLPQRGVRFGGMSRYDYDEESDTWTDRATTNAGPCHHTLRPERMFGSTTGDYVCAGCGALYTAEERDKLEGHS